MRAVALAVSVAMLGCFPHDARKQTYAKLVEGGAIVAGIAVEAIVNSGADCDQMVGVVSTADSCHTKASVYGDTGIALIIGGLLGFVATVSTADENKPAIVEIKAADKPADKPKLAL